MGQIQAIAATCEDGSQQFEHCINGSRPVAAWKGGLHRKTPVAPGEGDSAAAGGARFKRGRQANPFSAVEGDNHEQADVLVKLAKMSMSDLKKPCNTMNVNYSLPLDKTSLWTHSCKNWKQCSWFGQGRGQAMALQKRRWRLRQWQRHSFFHLLAALLDCDPD